MTNLAEICKLKNGSFTYSFKRADGSTWVSPKSWTSRSYLLKRLAESGMTVA